MDEVAVQYTTRLLKNRGSKAAAAELKALLSVPVFVLAAVSKV
jgi:hypothetical protein